MLRLAAAQVEVDLADRPRNLARAVSVLEAEAVRGVDLVVFPELSLTGYVMDSRTEAEQLAESVPGPSTAVIAEVCARRKITAVVGMLERHPDGRLFNAAVFVGPDGVRASYRKTHLPSMGIDRFLDRGDAFLPPIDIAGVRVSALICYDGTFPEPSRALALDGADLILLPTNWPEGESDKGSFLPAARALENVVWFAAVNRVTTERGIRFLGNSSISDPGGRTVARLDDRPGVIRAVIDPAISRQKRRITAPGLSVDRFGDRRPELYASIVRTGAPRA